VAERVSGKRIKLTRRGAGGLTSSRRARSFCGVPGLWSLRPAAQEGAIVMA